MLVADFNYELPEDLIAQQPAATREAARMLALGRSSGVWHDLNFTDFAGMLRAGDLLVLNDSRVIPVRLFAHRARRDARESGKPGAIEILLTEQLSEWEWKALAKPGKKVAVGERLIFSPRAPIDSGPPLAADVIDRGQFGERTVRFIPTPEGFLATLDQYGHIPLPPYIRHDDTSDDRNRYQTVFAQHDGSIAVPTAGLHFTREILDRLRQRGVDIAYVTLHVGLGTFQPLRVDRVADVQLHAERYTLPAETAAQLNEARRQQRRIVAAGTTTVRTIEHCAQQSGGELIAHSGSTSIFLAPGHRFQMVDALLTNFHLPQSSLLMLVCAFAGTERTLAAYRHAVAARYRFFSYGDCMFIS